MILWIWFIFIVGNEEKIDHQTVVQVHGDEHGGDFSLLAPGGAIRLNGGCGNIGMYDKPLSCYGCGIGWFT